MIENAHGIQAGNAVRVFVRFDDPAVHLYRLLRKTTDDIAGPADVTAVKVYEGEAEVVLDLAGLDNGVPYFYKAFPFDSGTDAFVDDGSSSVSATPGATYVETGPDVRSLILSRMDLGFQQEIARGLLKLKKRETGAASAVAVRSAPPVIDETLWPVCSVHMMDETPIERTLGEHVEEEAESESWLAGYVFNVISWSQDPDQRNIMHRSMKRIIQANLAVFDSAGMILLEPKFADQDFINNEFKTPVYTCMCTLTFRAPTGVTTPPHHEVIDDIEVVATVAVITEVEPA